MKVQFLAIAALAALTSVDPVSVPISDVRYDVTFDSATALKRTISVVMSFDTHGAGDVILSLPAWTPGEYEIDNFVRYVTQFAAAEGSSPATWNKIDQDTWRIHSSRAGSMRVSFDYLATSLDNAGAWTKPEFAFFNGTNLFLYPEGQSTEFPATVVIHTVPAWNIATGMTQASPNTF